MADKEETKDTMTAIKVRMTTKNRLKALCDDNGLVLQETVDLALNVAADRIESKLNLRALLSGED